METTCVRVSSKQTKINFGSKRNTPKQDLFGFVSVCFVKPKAKVSACFGLFRCFEPISKQARQKNCFITNRNNSKKVTFLKKISEEYPNILSFKLFGWVFCLFQFNRNIKTLCFCIEAKQPKQTVLKQTEKTDKNKKN